MFKEAFLKVVSAGEERILRVWDHPKNLTALMLSPQNGLLPDIARELHLKYFREYWSLDAVFYENKDKLYFSENDTFAENISVAVEHENNATYSHSEMNKLGLFNTPLAVIITYPGRNERKLLNDYSDILKRSDIFSDFGQKRQKLVVFGKSANQAVAWSFHLFDGEKFIKA